MIQKTVGFLVEWLKIIVGSALLAIMMVGLMFGKPELAFVAIIIMLMLVMSDKDVKNRA